MEEGIKKIDRLTKLNMISLFGDTVRKDIDYGNEFETERWMEIEKDGRVEKYHKPEKRIYIVRL